MKKNFFKKLSFVLALAMVLSVLTNVGPVFAAAGPTLTASHKYLHLDREDMPNEYNFNIKNKKSGWKYEWTSADEDVVTINEKNGIVTATGAGTTTIYCAITDKDGNEIAVLDAKVTVRDNIKELTITNTPDGALNVGEEWDFNRSYVTYANRTKGSAAITRWTVDDEENATINDKGVFVATKAGEYTIEARSFQSKAKYETWKDTKDEELVTSNVASFTVKVVAGMETPEQIDLRTVKVPFTSEVEDADKNLTLFYVMIGSTKVKVATVKAVTLADDKKSANIELYTDFTPEATYVIEHPEMEAVQFIAAKTGADQVDSITLNTATATVKEWTDISYTLRDKNGVDITASVPADRVTVTATTSKGIFANKRLYFFNVGDTAEVTVKYNAYKWENGVDVGARSASGTVMAVEAAATNITGASAWTIVPKTAAPDFANVKQILSVSDINANGKRLFVELNKLVGTESSKISSAAEEANFKYTTSDKSVLIIDNQGNLYPVKEGDVTIVVSYKDQVVAAIPVRVNAKREAVMIEPSTTAILLSNAKVDDYKDVTFKAYDNLGEELPVVLEGVEKLAGSPGSDIVTIVTGPAYRFSGEGAEVGTYNYQVKVNGLFTYITVNVSAPATDVEPSYVAEVTPGEVDLKTDGLADTNVTIKLYTYAGVKQSAKAVSGEGFKVIVKDPNGNDTVLTTNNYTLVDVVSGGAITKKPVGTYTVTVQKEYDVDGTSYYYDVYVTTFTVKDTTEAPTVEVKTLQSDKANLLQAIKDCFTFKLGNTEITSAVVDPVVIGNPDGTDVYVVSVDYYQTVGNATLKHTIPVGLTITKKAAKTN